jgi:HSP20 family molecular chaperone IbpA
MVRSIPPRTMSKVWRERSKPGEHLSREVSHRYKGKVYKKPRQWQYITKPFFKRIKEPIVDVFKEAEEVQVIIDLGNFKKGELNFGLKNKKYFISGKHEDSEFSQEIHLPYDVDIERMKEDFRNDILELILPKKNISRKRSRKNEK